MENSHLMLFICLAAPLSMMLLVMKGRSRAMLGFLLVGLFMCLFAGEINAFIINTASLSMRFMAVNVTPIVEELLKAAPIIFTAFLIKPEKQFLLESAVAVGVGFATMENVCLILDSASTLSALILVTRGFGAGMMHGVSTLAVGYSMTVAVPDKKLSFSGVVAAISAAIIYHSIYNILVQSAYPAVGILLPIASFIPLVILAGRYFGSVKRSD